MSDDRRPAAARALRELDAVIAGCRAELATFERTRDQLVRRLAEHPGRCDGYHFESPCARASSTPERGYGLGWPSGGHGARSLRRQGCVAATTVASRRVDSPGDASSTRRHEGSAELLDASRRLTWGCRAIGHSERHRHTSDALRRGVTELYRRVVLGEDPTRNATRGSP